MNDWNDAERRVEKARELFTQRRWEEALEELRAAIAINPYNHAWYFNAGVVLDEMNRFDEAADAYRESLEIHPDDIEALYHLGIDQSRMGRFREALPTFEHIEQVDASFEPAYCARIVVYTELADHEKADEMFYTARQYKDECPHCYYNIARSLMVRRFYDKAIYCWQKTLDLDENHPEVHQRIAEAYWAKGDRENARLHYLQELRANPGATRTMVDLGGLLMEMGRVDEAGEKFRQAIELGPDQPGAHYCHGRWLLMHGRPEEAEQALRQALKLDPTCPGAHLALADIAFGRGDIEEARRQVRSEVLLRSNDPNILLPLSNLLLDLNESRQAAALLKRLVRLVPDNPAAWQNLAVAQFLRAETGQGMASCVQALRCNPRNLAVMFNIALAHMEREEYPQAMEWVERALALQPDSAMHQHLRVRLRLAQMRAWVARLWGHLLFWRRSY